MWPPYIIFSLLANEALLFWSLVNVVFFFRKSRLFPRCYIGFMLFMALGMTLDQLLASMIPSVSQESKPEDLRDLIRIYIACFVWIPYFLKSKRVKVTFVQ